MLPECQDNDGPSKDLSESLDIEVAGLWRMADANWNRANEGIRVLEDFFRFVKNDSSLSFPLKQIRHQVQTILQDWPLDNRLQARDSIGDVGRVLATETEYQRPDNESLIQANFSRVSQSFRVLEEVAKRLELDGAQIESLRYRIYDLQKEFHTRNPLDGSHCNGVGRRKLLNQSLLYVLVDGGFAQEEFSPEMFACGVKGLASSGVDVIQIREKQLEDRKVLLLAKAAADVLAETNTLFIVNDRIDIALAAGADGVHVGQEELEVEVLRKIGGSELIIGLSTHNKDQVLGSATTSADYIGVGPVFGSKTKAFKSTFGTQLLEEVAGETKRPAFAIGGIGPNQIEEVLRSGFDRIAVSNAVCGAADPNEAAARLKTMLIENREGKN